MNKDNLLDMADYLDGGEMEGQTFDMRNYRCCVLGHGLRRWGDSEVSDYHLSEQAVELAKEMFGIREPSNAFRFCFGSVWGRSTRHAAADRLRYVAVHGDAPSEDQWHRFHVAERKLPIRKLDIAAKESVV